MIRLNTISMKFLFQLSCILKLGSFKVSLPHPTRSATSNSSASNQHSTVPDQDSAAPNENKVFAQFPRDLRNCDLKRQQSTRNRDLRNRDLKQQQFTRIRDLCAINATAI